MFIEQLIIKQELDTIMSFKLCSQVLQELGDNIPI